ncbi:hypothetical protein EWM64_g1037 [Hericium alpestre]|uniref:Uncharacterized protein n=1 Tax=Hericium alpestre TaxID=135208 RepID=A0A4Z0A8V5_9AGAM|nr:hypothetical protein EWM64_g1037 [Hericium alpestre]
MVHQFVTLMSNMFWHVFLFVVSVGWIKQVITTPGINQSIAALVDSNSSLLTWPTHFTQGIVPKPIHSHNDYWREVPMLTAISLGVVSVEADVWQLNGTLFVGHEEAALTPNRTFHSLYIDPLVQILDMMNPKDEFTVNATSRNGVFDIASSIPLQLLVDMKTDGNATLPAVLQALEPLRSAGYLTTFSNNTLTTSAVTVIGTGNTPFDGILALSPRDVFFDAPLDNLNSSTSFSPSVSPIASTDYGAFIGWSGIGGISDAQRATILTFVNDAHSRGIKARFWDTPGWPVRARESVWNELLNDGADWLNADDLVAASQF